jgi:N-acetylmuramoyl-L-alanine amidase
MQRTARVKVIQPGAERLNRAGGGVAAVALPLLWRDGSGKAGLCRRGSAYAESWPRLRSGVMRRNWRLAALLLTGLAVTACGTGAAAQAGGSGGTVQPGGTVQTTGPAATDDDGAAGASSSGAAHSVSPSAGPSTSARAAAKPLAGKTVGIDPGHNGRNKDDPSYINHRIWNGREWETCDTTGTETDGGYSEALFNWRVAGFLRADLRADGARVVLSRTSNDGVGPCVNRRTRIINRAHANVAIDIHADGGPASGRGFTVLEPVADGPNDKVIKSSVRFGSYVRTALLKYTRMPQSDYYGHDGVIFRDDLAGLNLATQPKILIETGNMRNARDARLLVQTWFQKRLAKAFTAAVVRFLAKR